MRGQTVMAGCQVNEDVLCKSGDFTSLLSEILALLRPHVLGSAGLRPHFLLEDRMFESAHTKSRPQKRAHFLRPHFVT